MKLRAFLSICAAILIFGCGEDTVKKTPQEKKVVKIPAFDEQAAYDYVAHQVDVIGHRHHGTPGSKEAIDWMYNTLSSFEGWEVSKQTFKDEIYTGEEVTGVNIIGRYKPEVQERVMLCAHWDSRFIAEKDTIRQDQSILGANDGASGVGVLMEIAKTISAHPIPMGVDIVFFDLEDQGENGAGNVNSWGLGSQYFAQNPPERPYSIKYGILLDMVGHADATFPMEGLSRRVAPEAVKKIWNVARILKKDKYFVDRLANEYIDDHYFLWNMGGIPVVDIIHLEPDGNFMKEHHTHADNMDIIDAQTLDAVGQVVLTTIYKESNGQF